MKKTHKVIRKDKQLFSFLGLPNTNIFRVELTFKCGSDIEKIFKKVTGTEVYGISHLIEHLSFKSTLDYTTDELEKDLRQYGQYNAFTRFEDVSYFYKTTQEHMCKAIELVHNIVLNDLSRVTEEEFDKEKEIVLKEANMVRDDFNRTFGLTAKTLHYNNDIADTIIGTPESISSLTLDLVKKVKHIFLEHAVIDYDIVYDPTLITPEDIMLIIEKETRSFKITKYVDENINYDEFIDFLDNRTLPPLTNIDKVIVNPSSQQKMSFVAEASDINVILLSYVLTYINKFAPDTNLTKIVREKNGLTYNIAIFNNTTYGIKQLGLNVAVEHGNRDLLIEKVLESLKLTLDNFNQEDFNKYLERTKIIDTIAKMDLNDYNYYAYDFYTKDHENYLVLEKYLNNDMDEAISLINKTFIENQDIRSVIEYVYNIFKDKKYSLVYSTLPDNKNTVDDGNEKW